VPFPLSLPLRLHWRQAELSDGRAVSCIATSAVSLSMLHSKMTINHRSQPNGRKIPSRSIQSRLDLLKEAILSKNSPQVP
jgi:hypothetical protein